MIESQLTRTRTISLLLIIILPRLFISKWKSVLNKLNSVHHIHFKGPYTFHVIVEYLYFSTLYKYKK